METIFPIFYTFGHFGFKSYYVVWKREKVSIEYKKKKSLNRTMQYGNQTLEKSKKQNKKSLNRTMQYGNFQ